MISIIFLLNKPFHGPSSPVDEGNVPWEETTLNRIEMFNQRIKVNK